MPESHHLISSLLSPVTISRSRYRSRVQLSFEHLGLYYLKVFFFQNWECFSALLLVFNNNNWPVESLHLFKINEPWKFLDVAFIRKYDTFQSSNATRAIFWSKTSHIIATTCNWLRVGNTSRVLIWQENMHGRFTWTSFADCANLTIKAKHIHRWQLANAFCSSAYHALLTVYPVSTKANKNKYSITCAFTGGVS